MSNNDSFGYPVYDETCTSCWSRRAAAGHGIFDDTREKLNLLVSAVDRWMRKQCVHSHSVKRTGDSSIDRHREAIVLQMHVLEGYTYSEIGVVFGLTGSRVRQMEAKALRLLRNPVRSRHLKWYADGSMWGDPVTGD